MQPNFVAHKITQAMIVIESQILNCGLKKIVLKFQYIEEESDMCNEEFLEFTETLDMSVRTNQNLKIGPYVVAN